ncbi:MAG TPA: hypothetical protein VGO62_01100 [Myxococcota bacterium]
MRIAVVVAVVFVSATGLAPLAGCDGTSASECVVDSDCDRGQTCNSSGTCIDDAAREGEGEGAAAGEGEGAAGEGEGEGEGAPQCTARDNACHGTGVVNEQADCCDGDVCVPVDNNASVGVCRQKCGDISAADGTITKDANVVCGAGRTCQTVTPLPDVNPASEACVAPTTVTNGVCHDLFDDTLGDAACPANEDCQSTLSDFTGGFASLNCKLPCDVSDAASVQRCTNLGQTCVTLSADVPVSPIVQVDDLGAQVRCDDGAVPAGVELQACVDGTAGCPCDGADGFVCTNFTLAAGGTGFFCNKPQSNCGVAVPPTTQALFTADPGHLLADPAERCNAVDDSRYCDQSSYVGATGTVGLSQCVGISAVNNDGICFPICSFPAVDTNGNGAIDIDEAGSAFSCGTNFHCDTALAANVGLFSTAANVTCTDDTQCTVGDEVCQAGQCVGFFGSCEPN